MASNPWLAEFGFHSGRDGSEPFVFRPQPASVQMARCQQVDINQANAASHESMSLEEQENLVILDLVHRRKGVQQGHDFPPVRQIPAGQFPKDKRMHGNLVHFQERGEGAARHTEVVNPNGCVHEHHYAALRRGMRLAPGSEPPSAAKRRALWRATRASRPIRTNAVFSFTPVSRDARAKIPSSMLSVVFIHLNMDNSDVFVKVKPDEAVTGKEKVESGGESAMVLLLFQRWWAGVSPRTRMAGCIFIGGWFSGIPLIQPFNR
jgi:hypothetical protein